MNARAALPPTALVRFVTIELYREKLKKNKGTSVVRIATTWAEKKKNKKETTIRTSKNMKIVNEKDIIKNRESQNIKYKLFTLLQK